MQRISVFLWVALAGAVLQLTALGSDFYIVGDERRDAWLGIPHTSDLILASALVTILLLALTAANRSPLRGRNVGIVVGVLGLLATLQLAYRMWIPPFGCLQYGCSPSEAQDVTLLTGIWVGLAGNVLATLGGFLHAASPSAGRAQARPWVASAQGGMSPWLGVAALGAVAMFVFGFVGFDFYTVTGFVGNQEPQTWGGWLSIPHTSSLVLAMALGVVGLAWAAGRERSPLGPSALGAVIAVLGFIAGSRILFRILEPPFTAAAGRTQHVGSVAIELPAFLSLAGAVVVVVAGIAQAVTHRETAARAEPAPGPA